MAKRKTSTTKAPVMRKPEPVHCCRECAHAYNWHNKSLNGNMILCYCQYHHEGKYCKLLSDRSCGHFEQR